MNEFFNRSTKYDVWATKTDQTGGVLMVKALDCRIVVSLNSSHTITFTFGQIPLRKV